MKEETEYILEDGSFKKARDIKKSKPAPRPKTSLPKPKVSKFSKQVKIKNPPVKHLKKSVDTLISKIKKGGVGSGRKKSLGVTSTKYPLNQEPLAVRTSAQLGNLPKYRGEKFGKSLPERTQAYLSVQKAISLMEGYEPMSDADIKKAFGEIPEFAKAEDERPPKEWFDNCLNRAKDFATDPNAYCGALWYSEKYPRKMEKAGKPWTREQWHNMREAFGKSAKSVLGAGLGGFGGGMLAGPIGAGLGAAAGSKIGESMEKKPEEKVEKGIVGEALEPVTGPAKSRQRMAEKGQEQAHEVLWGSEDSEEETDEDKVEKQLIPGALLGGGIGSLVGHPIAGAAIGAGAGSLLPKLLHKAQGYIDTIRKQEELSDIDPEILGRAVLQAFFELLGEVDEEDEEIKKQVGLIGPALKTGAAAYGARKGWEMAGKREKPQKVEKFNPAIVAAAAKAAKDAYEKPKKSVLKAVAENVDSKYGPKQREPDTDFGGSSEVSSAPMDANVKDLSPSKKEETN